MMCKKVDADDWRGCVKDSNSVGLGCSGFPWNGMRDILLHLDTRDSGMLLRLSTWDGGMSCLNTLDSMTAWHLSHLTIPSSPKPSCPWWCYIFGAVTSKVLNSMEWNYLSCFMEWDASLSHPISTLGTGNVSRCPIKLGCWWDRPVSIYRMVSRPSVLRDFLLGIESLVTSTCWPILHPHVMWMVSVQK